MKCLLAIMALGVSLPTLAWAQAGDAQNERFVVVLNPVSGPPAVVAEGIARATGGRVGFVYENVLRGFSIAMPPRAAARLRLDQRVAYIEPDIEMRAVGQTISTGIPRIFADKTMLDIDGTDDQRVDADVAVLDTGIDLQHPDLHVVGGANCLGGRLFAKCDATKSYDDDNVHGTHVAGIVAAIDNGFGVVGVAPGARLWAVKVLDAQGSGSLSGIIAGIDWVVAQNRIEVINMSLSGAAVSQAMNDAVARAVSNGVTVIAAAGNSDADAAGYTPANAPEAIAVSALADFNGQAGGGAAPTCRSDVDDTLADFSNWGSTVDIAAPGVCILSTIPIEAGEYATYSGTSMAAPHVAGAAALLASRSTTPASIRTALLGGNFDWTDESGDGAKEPLLDISGSVFAPVLIAPTTGGTDDGGTDGGGTTSPGKGNGKKK